MHYVSSGHSDWAKKIDILWTYKQLQKETDKVIDKIIKKDKKGKYIGYDVVEIAKI